MYYISKATSGVVVGEQIANLNASFFIVELIHDARKTQYMYNKPVTIDERKFTITLSATDTDVETGEYLFRCYVANNSTDVDVSGKSVIFTSKLRIQ